MRRVAIVGAGMTPFGEHFDLGIKDLVPMAVSEMAWPAWTRASTAIGHRGGVVRRADVDRRLRLRHPGRSMRAARHSGHPRGERVRDRSGRVAQRRLRRRLRVHRRRAGGRGGQGARDVGPDHVLGLDGHDPGHGVGLPARPGGPGQLRPPRRSATSTRRRRPGSTSP